MSNAGTQRHTRRIARYGLPSCADVALVDVLLLLPALWLQQNPSHRIAATTISLHAGSVARSP